MESIVLFTLILLAGNLYGREKHEEGYTEGYYEAYYDQSPAGKIEKMMHELEFKKYYGKKKSEKVLSGMGTKTTR